MDAVAVLGGRRAVGGRADERVRELDPSPDREQPSVHRGVHRRHVDLESLRSGLEQERVAERLGGRGEDEELRVGRESEQTTHVALLDPAGDQMGLGEREPASELSSVPRSWELEQRERVAVALRDDLIADGRVQRADQVLEQQSPCVAIVEWADDELGESRHDAVADPRARAAHDRDPVGKEAACNERQRARGCLV